ncbi:hypothetical protein F5972_33055 [Microbispora cellulosiformans]|uniref:Uncharacterized protein n=1 Tax=Microbispora cellulosiformans TaxID=2614688 RepID=A0A5J5JTU4_9ACTN|nr:hypothetical protein [Microbispora cellulosiformans]KAA9374061.1 hypothetical protein F5972_33055 [Microbispora cellulosiformans]
MGEHRGGSRGELKHGALVAGTVLLVLGLVAAWSVLIPGFMDWDEIVAAVIGSLRLTGPVGAAFAAWVALRRRRAEHGRVLTPWRAARAPLSIIAVVTGSFGATVLLLGLRAALTGQGGALLPGGLAMSVAGLGLYVMVGWILGWLLPVTVVPLLAGAGTYGVFTLLATGPNWAGRLIPAARQPYELLTVGATSYADQALWLVGLSAALFLGWVALVTGRTLALAAAAIAVLAAGTGAARLVSEPRTTLASERYACQEWPITVCVRPALRAGLTDLAGMFTMLAARLAGTPAAFKRVEQRAPGEGGPVAPGVVVVHLGDLGAGYAQRAATEFLDGLARPCSGVAAEGYRAIVVAWLRNDPLPPGAIPEQHAAALWFSELTDAQRHDWLRLFYSDFVSCGLQARHFGGGTRPVNPAVTPYPVNPTPADPAGHPGATPSAGAPVPTGEPGASGTGPVGAGPADGAGQGGAGSAGPGGAADAAGAGGSGGQVPPGEPAGPGEGPPPGTAGSPRLRPGPWNGGSAAEGAQPGLPGDTASGRQGRTHDGIRNERGPGGRRTDVGGTGGRGTDGQGANGQGANGQGAGGHGTGDAPGRAPGHAERRGVVEHVPGPGRDDRRTGDDSGRGGTGTGTRDTGSRDTGSHDTGQDAPQVTDVPAALLAPS